MKLKTGIHFQVCTSDHKMKAIAICNVGAQQKTLLANKQGIIFISYLVKVPTYFVIFFT